MKNKMKIFLPFFFTILILSSCNQAEKKIDNSNSIKEKVKNIIPDSLPPSKTFETEQFIDPK